MKYSQYYKLFYKYEKVRLSGEFNMITQAADAAKAAKMRDSDYLKIVHKYSFIMREIVELVGHENPSLEEIKQISEGKYE